MTSVSTQVRVLEGAIGRIVDSLQEASTDAETSASREPEHDSLLFLGNWHDAYPSILVRDRSLTDSAKVQLLYLMQEARRNPQGAIALPSAQRTCTDLGQARGTVIRDRTLLRLTRWVSLCQRVRDTKGRFRGNVYAIHGEPASLADTVYLDGDYMTLIEESAVSHYDPLVLRVARAVLAAIDQDIAEGRDPLDPPDPIEQRLQATAALQGEDRRFFALNLTVLDKTPAGSPEEELGSVQDLDPVPSPKSGPGSEQPGPKFGPGYPPIESNSSSNSGPGDVRSSRSMRERLREMTSEGSASTNATDRMLSDGSASPVWNEVR
jgi:hypothetical protein